MEPFRFVRGGKQRRGPARKGTASSEYDGDESEDQRSARNLPSTRYQLSSTTPLRIPAMQIALARQLGSRRCKIPNRNAITTAVRRIGEITEINASGWAMAVK